MMSHVDVPFKTVSAQTVNFVGYKSTCVTQVNALNTTAPLTATLAACMKLCMNTRWCRSVDWCGPATGVSPCLVAGQPECSSTCNMKAYRAADSLALLTTASATCNHYDGQ